MAILRNGPQKPTIAAMEEMRPDTANLNDRCYLTKVGYARDDLSGRKLIQRLAEPKSIQNLRPISQIIHLKRTIQLRWLNR